MRRENLRMAHEEALALLARAPLFHLATTTPAGAPVLRALDGALVLAEGALVFHGSRAGEKAACLGRPAVVSAEEVVAHLPSRFVDPARACPATTFFRSVQVHGRLEEVTDLGAKARGLEALLARWQRPGSAPPLLPGEPRDAAALERTLVLRVPLEQVDGKAKLGQDHTPAQRGAIVEGLWRRGAPGDVEALEAVRAACPGTPVPAALAGPPGVTLHAALPPGAEAEVAALLEGTYWWAGLPPGLPAEAQRSSTARVGARGPDGRLVAAARATADARTAWLYDVIVAPAWRGRGLGQRVVALLLDHPAVRGAARVRLTTRDAQGLYARFGFVELPAGGAGREMVLVRGGG